jgi:hypothetical protein
MLRSGWAGSQKAKTEKIKSSTQYTHELDYILLVTAVAHLHTERTCYQRAHQQPALLLPQQICLLSQTTIYCS